MRVDTRGKVLARHGFDPHRGLLPDFEASPIGFVEARLEMDRRRDRAVPGCRRRPRRDRLRGIRPRRRRRGCPSAEFSRILTVPSCRRAAARARRATAACGRRRTAPCRACASCRSGRRRCRPRSIRPWPGFPSARCSASAMASLASSNSTCETRSRLPRSSRARSTSYLGFIRGVVE